MSDKKENPSVRKFSAILSIMGIGLGNQNERIILDGMDVTHFIREITTESLPGELMRVTVAVLPMKHSASADEMAVDIPEALATVTAFDPIEMTELRIALDEAVHLLEGAVYPGMHGAQEVLERIARFKRMTAGPEPDETIAHYIRRRERL